MCQSTFDACIVFRKIVYANFFTDMGLSASIPRLSARYVTGHDILITWSSPPTQYYTRYLLQARTYQSWTSVAEVCVRQDDHLRKGLILFLCYISQLYCKIWQTANGSLLITRNNPEIFQKGWVRRGGGGQAKGKGWGENFGKIECLFMLITCRNIKKIHKHKYFM